MDINRVKSIEEKEINPTENGNEIISKSKKFKLDLTSEDDFNDMQNSQTIEEFVPQLPILQEIDIKNRQNRIDENQNIYMTLDKLNTWAKEGPQIVNVNPPEAFTALYEPNDEVNKKISFWFRGDSSKLVVDAIVNGASNGLWPTPGISEILHKAAGPEMEIECKNIGHTQTGRCCVTKGYNLPAKYCIHAVGPIGTDQKKLEEAYISVLKCIDGKNIRSIGLCTISTDLYGYPIQAATEVAFTQVRKFLEDRTNRENTDRIVFVIHDRGNVAVYSKMRHLYFPLTIKYTFKETSNCDELIVQSDGNISIASDRMDTDNESITDDASADNPLSSENIEISTRNHQKEVLPDVPQISHEIVVTKKHVTFGDRNIFQLESSMLNPSVIYKYIDSIKSEQNYKNDLNDSKLKSLITIKEMMETSPKFDFDNEKIRTIFSDICNLIHQKQQQQQN